MRCMNSAATVNQGESLDSLLLPSPFLCRSRADRFLASLLDRPLLELKVENYIFIFVRLIHLIAHHPDYTNEPEDLKSIARWVLVTSLSLVLPLSRHETGPFRRFDYRYIEFYLDLVMAKENVSLLYALSAKVKTVKDRDPQYSKVRPVLSRRRSSSSSRALFVSSFR